MTGNWCHVCCCRHGAREPCPGELEATGPERRSWRINVNAAGGAIEAFGVLLAPCKSVWRARIFTYPRALWIVPGGNATMKFIGRTPEEAERQAISYIREFCAARGYRPRPGGQDESSPPPTVTPADAPERHHPRMVQFHHVRYGTGTPSASGSTADVSVGGLFVMTDEPLAAGTELNLLLDLGDRELALQGQVRWTRLRPHDGRATGMGVQLNNPGEEWLEFLRSL